MITAFFMFTVNTTRSRHMVILYSGYGNYYVGIVAMVAQCSGYSSESTVRLNSVRPAPQSYGNYGYLTVFIRTWRDLSIAHSRMAQSRDTR